MNSITFKEYLEIEQDYEILMNLDEASLLKLLTSPPMFAAGAVGNVLGQTARGAGNIVGGGVEALGGLGSGAVGALQYLGGDKEARKNARKKMRSGVGNVAGGAGKVLRGAAQIAATPITAPIRGAQILDDEGFSGILAPNDSHRSYLQDLFGLSSGSKKDVPKPVSRAEPEAKRIDPDKVRVARSAVIKTSEHLPDTISKEWFELVEALKKASSVKEAVRIMSYMKRKFPFVYEGAINLARQIQKGRPATDPSGRLRSAARKVKPF